MTGVSQPGVAAYGLAGAVLAADQASKHWILYGLELPRLVSVQAFGPLHLTMVWNQGVSFGMLQATQDLVRWGLVAFSLAVAAVLGAWARRAERTFSAIGLGLVIGGALGNAIDRARYGAVVDFIDASRLWFPWVFNIADSGITIGVICLVLDSARKDRSA